MKEYKEDFIHPETKEKQSIPVYEYSFEDWENGTISTNWKPGKRLTRNIDTNQYNYEFLPFEEKQKIISRTKELYIKKVQKETDLLKSIFELRYSKSEAKELLLKNEIELYQKLLSNELLPIGMLTNMIQPLELVLPSWNMPFPVIDPETKTFKGIQHTQYYSPTKLDTITINSIRETYKQIIIEGNKDYSLTESSNNPVRIGSGDTHLIRVEAIHNYIQYLNTFANNRNLPKFTELENSGKRLLNDIKTAKNDKIWQNTPKKIVRISFINELINSYNFNTILDKHISIKEQIISDIENEDIPYIFALFECLGYREILAEYFVKKELLFKKLTELLGTNKRDITGNWNVLNPNSKENQINYTSNDFLQTIRTKYSLE